MTTHWNPAHADEEPEAAGNHETGRPARDQGTGSGQDAPGGEQAWNGYVVPEAEQRANAGWAPPVGGEWPTSRPVGPPASSYPALRRAVDQQSGPEQPEAEQHARSGGPSDASTAPVPQFDAQEPPRADAGDGDGDGDQGRGTGGQEGRGSEQGAHTSKDGGAEGTGESGQPAPLPKRNPRQAAESGPRQARREQEAGASGTEAPARSGHGRHAAAPASAEKTGTGAPATGDPDDPDRLADWVGSLADVNESNMIAGRRTGPIPVINVEEDAPPQGGLDTSGQETGAAAAGAQDPEAGGGVSGRRYWADDSAADDEDFAPAVADDEWEPMPEVTREQLITRLDAVSALVGIGADDFDPELIDQAQHMLDHAGARLRLSGDHTVVALAGGTGSGKSSLFNTLCGLDFSRVGITRPTTSDVHACVWGNEGAEGLLDWLEVPRRSRHSRTSELDKTTSDLSGLILLDLPDHDSVRAEHTAEAARLIGSCDLLVWVLDPQKYADAAVHHRYLAEMTGHGSVTVAVLNQVDRVERGELEELLTDLRRLLETESGVHPRVLTTSTLTGQGIRTLHNLLAETVSARRAQIDRLVADLDRVVVGFERYHGDSDEIGTAVPDRVRSGLVDDLMEAGGVAAIADSAETAFERRGERRVGWPIGRWARKTRRDALSAVGDGFSGDFGRAAPVDAYGAGIDKAAVDVADYAAGSLPVPWPRRVRAAARSGLDLLPDELSEAVTASVPDPDDTPNWWRGVQAVQYLLVALAGVGIVWFFSVLASWLSGGLTGLAVLDAPLFLAFAAAVAVATPLAGWLTGLGCSNLVGVSAAQRREQVEQRSSRRARDLAEQRILAPVEQELARYAESCRALATAQGTRD